MFWFDWLFVLFAAFFKTSKTLRSIFFGGGGVFFSDVTCFCFSEASPVVFEALARPLRAAGGGLASAARATGGGGPGQWTSEEGENLEGLGRSGVFLCLGGWGVMIW